MSSWFERLAPEDRERVGHALRVAGQHDQAEFLRELDASQRAGMLRGSRQALHARLQRAMASAAASVVMAAPLDPDVEAFQRSEGFARLHALGAETHHKATSLVELVRFDEPARYEGLFERTRGPVVDLARRVRELGLTDLLRLQSMLPAAFYGPIFFGEHFAPHWLSLRDELQRENLLDNPWMRLQVALMSMWCQRPDDHVRWLLDTSVRDVELADSYTFVRTDTLDDLYERCGELTRGDRPEPTRCLFPPRPLSTLSRMIDYVLGCMRDPMHFRNEGMVLMPLVWIDDIHTHLGELESSGALGADLTALRTRLSRFESVQVMEKARFFEVVDRTADPTVRETLLRYWHRSYAAQD
jgi:hypothetical protein